LAGGVNWNTIALTGSSSIDYLLKSFGAERFRPMLERVRAHLAAGGPPGAVERTRLTVGGAPLRRLFARSGPRIVSISVESIRSIKAAVDYAGVDNGAGRHLLHLSLGELLSRLDPESFQQVHRSYIVNLDYVRQIRLYDKRRLIITMDDGSEIMASRKASEELRRLVKCDLAHPHLRTW
jgi:two-component system LytT family response regulator